jgi:hypothetical protein
MFVHCTWVRPCVWIFVLDVLCFSGQKYENVGALVYWSECQTCDVEVLGSTFGRCTRSRPVEPFIPPGTMKFVPAMAGG